MSASSSVINLPAPVTATQAGATDPDGNLKALLVDADGALITSSGGSGDNASVGPTGQPVPADATFIGGRTVGGDLTGILVDSSGQLQVEVTESALPDGAATEATLGNCNSLLSSIESTLSELPGAPGVAPPTVGILSLGEVSTSAPTYLSGVAGSLSLTTDGLLRVDGSGSTQPISGTVAATQSGTWVSRTQDGAGNAINSTSNALNVSVQNTTVAVTQSGTWTVQPGNTANTTAWLVTQQGSSSASTSNVNDTASSTTLIASNSSRRGAAIFNDSTVSLYVKFGATASATSFTVLIAAQGYYELPANPSVYTGVVDGIWASDASGAARITEW